MGKKKKFTKFEDDPISNAICTEYGEMIKEGNDVLDKLKELNVLSLSPALDLALGGGIREGTCTIFTGDPKTGKSVTALSFAGNCQRLYGKKIYYFDTEGRLTKEHLTQIEGLDISKNFKVISPTDEVPVISAEMYLTALEQLVKEVDDVVAIVDSTSNMLPMKELTGEISAEIRAGLPKMLTTFLKRVSGDVGRRGAIVIFVTHNIANTNAKSAFAKQKRSDGGNQLQYQAGNNLIITHKEDWKVSEQVIGQKVNWVIKTSAAGGFPESKTVGWIRYGVGIDRYQEIGTIATELSLIRKGGAWYTILVEQFMDEKVVQDIIAENEVDPEDKEAVEKLFKFQGMQNVADFLRKYPDLAEFLYRKVMGFYE